MLDAIGAVGRASFGGGRTLSPPRRVHKISRFWGHRIIAGRYILESTVLYILRRTIRSPAGLGSRRHHVRWTRFFQERRISDSSRGMQKGTAARWGRHGR